MTQTDNRKRLCQCWSSQTDFFNVQNLIPGSCDSRDFTNEKRGLEESGINVFSNQHILTPFESCWDAEFYSTIRMTSTNATIRYDNQNTFVITFIII